MTTNRKQWYTYLIGYFTSDHLTEISKIYSPENKRYQMLHYEKQIKNSTEVVYLLVVMYQMIYKRPFIHL